MKHLPKHLQPRWRYLAVDIESWPDATIDRDAFQRELWYGAQNLLGDAGSAALDLSVVDFAYSEGTGAALVRTRRGEVDRARAVVACLDEVDSRSVGVRVAGTSGTIRGCEEKYMKRGREEPEQRYVVLGDAERTGHARNGRVDVRTGGGFAGATTLECQ